MSQIVERHYLIVKKTSEESITGEHGLKKIFIVHFQPDHDFPSTQALTYATLDESELVSFPVGTKVEVLFKIKP